MSKQATYTPKSSDAPKITRATVSNSYDAVKLLADIRGAMREHFVCFDLNARHGVIARRIVAIGSLCGVDVHPREVFKDAILNSAAAILVAHNHPSGDPSPSMQDKELTGRLRQVGELLGIKVLDHVVVSDTAHVSMAERGWT
jgi:DNA repair protein RadC